MRRFYHKGFAPVDEFGCAQPGPHGDQEQGWNLDCPGPDFPDFFEPSGKGFPGLLRSFNVTVRSCSDVTCVMR